MQVQTKVMKISLLYVFVVKEGITLQYLINGNYLLSDKNCKDKAQISILTLSTNISVTCLTSEYLAFDYVFCGQNKIQSMKYDLVNIRKCKGKMIKYSLFKRYAALVTTMLITATIYINYETLEELVLEGLHY